SIADVDDRHARIDQLLLVADWRLEEHEEIVHLFSRRRLGEKTDEDQCRDAAGQRADHQLREIFLVAISAYELRKAQIGGVIGDCGGGSMGYGRSQRRPRVEDHAGWPAYAPADE